MFDLSKTKGSLLTPLATVVGCVDGKEDPRWATYGVQEARELSQTNLLSQSHTLLVTL